MFCFTCFEGRVPPFSLSLWVGSVEFVVQGQKAVYPALCFAWSGQHLGWGLRILKSSENPEDAESLPFLGKRALETGLLSLPSNFELWVWGWRTDRQIRNTACQRRPRGHHGGARLGGA